MQNTVLGFTKFKRRNTAFTLVEMLVVMAIIALLSAILLPVFWTVRGIARATSCRSNLSQIGKAFAMYSQDYDSLYPYGIDHQDRTLGAANGAWDSHPAFAAQLATLPYTKDLLQPYLKSKQILICPADSGYDIDDFFAQPLAARPTSGEAFGSSYYYNTELAVSGTKTSMELAGSNHVVFYDAAGSWHGAWLPRSRRYNVLCADGHVKNLNTSQFFELYGN